MENDRSVIQEGCSDYEEYGLKKHGLTRSDCNCNYLACMHRFMFTWIKAGMYGYCRVLLSRSHVVLTNILQNKMDSSFIHYSVISVVNLAICGISKQYQPI